MSVLHCTVKSIKPGTMKNGNPYQRLCLDDGTGQDQWMPCFNGRMVSVGDKLIATIKEGQYSEQYGQSYIIDDFVLEGGDSATQATSQPHTNRPAEANSSAPDADTWRKKDLHIATQAAFKAMASNPGYIDRIGDYEPLAKEAFRIAKYWEKAIKAYVAGADVDGLKRNLADDVQAAIEQDNHADNTEVAGPEHTSQPDDPGFDDDLPF